jgi:alpha-tubulin suppressor-like RCC1 family protein
MKSCLMMLTVVVSFLLASCSGPAPTTYVIGGSVSGLSGTGLVLQDNGTDNLSISVNGGFTFATALISGSSFTVTVLTQPSSPAQTCMVASGTGTASLNVTAVQITCTTNAFTVGVTVAGLTGKNLVLQDNGGDNLTVNANGNFTFATSVPRGNTYSVSVLTQPSGPAQTCDVINGFGTAFSNVTGVIAVNCFNTTVTYQIGGTVSGLVGKNFVLQNNSGNNLLVSANGTFVFTTPVASGDSYSVTVYTQPSSPAQTCVVTGGSGTATVNITGIQVTCTTNTYTVGVTVSGLAGAPLVLQDNATDNLSISTNGNFTFATALLSGNGYSVTVFTQPSNPTQACVVANGSGTSTVSVTGIQVTCTTTNFNVGVTVSGLLLNTSVVLQEDGSDNLTVTANGTATNFTTAIPSGSSYAVTVLTQPAGLMCILGTNSTGTITNANINVAVTCGPAAAAGESHTCVVTSAGAVLCWGLNEYGQLGNGTTTNSATPVPVTGLSSGVVAITAGSESTCALTNAGAVWCWGHNATGQLGNGTLTQSSVPVEVLGSASSAPLSGVVSIAAGQDHTCAVTSAGAALCWGDNSEGELGNGTGNGSNIPVAVSGLSSGVASISAGSSFTCALTTAGAALCWGQGSSGQLGNGNLTNSASPTVVLDATGNAPLGGVEAISAGFENACALTIGGTALCWGANDRGQLGDGSNSSLSSVPLQVLASSGQLPLNGVAAVTGGLDDSCALTTAGTALCWGSNGSGELGNGSTTDASTPVPVYGLSRGVAPIVAGYDHTCAVTTAGAVLCWGEGSSGQLGNGSNTTSSTPVQVVGVGGTGFLRLF